MAAPPTPAERLILARIVEALEADDVARVGALSWQLGWPYERIAMELRRGTTLNGSAGLPKPEPPG